MKRLVYFFVVLTLIMPFSFINAQQVDDLPEIAPIKIIPLGEIQSLNKVTSTMSVIISSFTGPDTLDLNQRGQWYIIWTPSLAGTYKLLASYSDGQKDSIITVATANTGYGTYLYHKFSVSGNQSVTISITGQETASSTKPVYIRPLVNQIPIITNFVVPDTVQTSQQFQVSISGRDPDGQILNFSIIIGLVGQSGVVYGPFSVNGTSVNQVLSYIFNQAVAASGNYQVTAQLTDSNAYTVTEVKYFVAVNPNLPPQFVLVQYKANVVVGEDIGLRVTVMDPDNQYVDMNNTYGDGVSYDFTCYLVPGVPSVYTPSHSYSNPGVYTINLKLRDHINEPVTTSVTVNVGTVTSVENLGLPTEFTLSQNYPNPFNPTTSIQYSLPEAAEVKLTIHDMLGREIKTLVNGYNNAGIHNVNFDGSDLTSGVYIYRIFAGKFVETKKMTLIK